MNVKANGVTGAAIKRAIEGRDGRMLSSFYADDAIVRVIDRNNPPSRPREIRGRSAITTFWDDICSRAMTHEMAAKHVYDAFLSDDFTHALMHGPTYAGNALACAAANASLDLFEREPRLAQVAAIAERLMRELAPCAGLAGVRSVRVKGAIGVVELEREPDRDGLVRRFIEAGVWIRPFGNIVYVTPPFTIAPDELGCLTRAIYAVLSGK